MEPWWNPGGTLVEPSGNLTSGSPRTTPEPIWAETPKLSAVGGKHNTIAIARTSHIAIATAITIISTIMQCSFLAIGSYIESNLFLLVEAMRWRASQVGTEAPEFSFGS